MRAINALAEEGIMTVSVLCAMTEEELLGLYGIGPKAVMEIKEALEDEGSRLREE